MRKRVTLVFAVLMMALTMSFGGVAFAKISPVDTSCTNGGGNQASSSPRAQVVG
jgi:hypothetical protein